jgi:NAD(P)-dependent dehydrogenase (short-subunit alcohol dehydrogenase family)
MVDGPELARDAPVLAHNARPDIFGGRTVLRDGRVVDACPMSNDTLAGRTAIVTGGSRGIGLGIAAAIVGAGGSVCVTARKPDQLAAAVEELGARAIGVAGAADDAVHRRDAFAQTRAAFGPVDLLVNNAGINPLYGRLLDSDDDDAMRKTLQVNVLAPIAWSREAWRAGMREHGGAILNVASLGGLVGDPNLGIYNVSKAALIHLTRQLAVELAPRVRVNGIAPAVVRTRFARALYEHDEPAVAATYPLQRLGEVQDTSAAALYLLSGEAAWITGQTLVVDGGISLRLAGAAPEQHAVGT